MTEKKTAEEMLRENLQGMSVRIPPVLMPHILRSHKQFAAQELAEYKLRLKEAFPSIPELQKLINEP